MIECVKYTTKKYPLLSRPMFTKRTYALYDAISKRLLAATKYRKIDIDPTDQVRMIIKAWFKPNWQEITRSWGSTPLTIDPVKTAHWISHRP